ILLRRKDNTAIQTEIKFTAIVDSPNNNSVQAIIRDVTEQKRMENTLRQNNQRLEILNSFSHKLASTMELSDIYKTCVNTVTNELGFYGCIYFIMDKSERFYKIMEYSGEYFNKPGRIDPFLYINRNAKALSCNDYDGIVLDYEQIPQYLVMNDSIEYESCYKQAYIQQLRVGGYASGLFIVLSKSFFIDEELNVLRSIGHTTLAAVENTMHLIESKNNFVQTIDALIAAIEAKDQYTRGHSQRVASIAVKIANRIGMTKQQAEELRIAGILHDIGKIGISDRILLKKGPLTKEEYEIIKKHPAISNRILYPIGLSDRILKAVAFHHERFDGKGYPFGLTNESLGLEPQIIAVADAYDAMTSSRPYRGALSYEKAINELKNNKGTQFHPGIVNVMLQLLEEREVT
ncbi:MAG TPA: HD-GYP domain-containing protein, partial [Clostridia bacterium]